MRNQLVERAGRINQSDLQMVVFQGDDDGARIEPQNLREIGAGDAPAFATDAARCSSAACSRLARSSSTAGTRSRESSSTRATSFSARSTTCRAAGVLAAMLMNVEIRVGGRQQRVIFRGLDVQSLGVERLPGCQRLKDGVRQIDGLIKAPISVEVIQILIQRPARRRSAIGGIVHAEVEVRAETVVAVVQRADVEVRNPEQLRTLELRLGNPGAGLRGGDDQGPGVGQPQRRG